MKQLPRVLTHSVVAGYGPEFLRHILLAVVALLLAVPIRHAQQALIRLAHGGPARPAVAQLWPTRLPVPADLLR